MRITLLLALLITHCLVQADTLTGRVVRVTDVNENCGVNLTVHIYRGTKNYIKVITVTMVDYQQVLRDIKATDLMVAEHEKKLRDKKNIGRDF